MREDAANLVGGEEFLDLVAVLSEGEADERAVARLDGEEVGEEALDMGCLSCCGVLLLSCIAEEGEGSGVGDGGLGLSYSLGAVGLDDDAGCGIGLDELRKDLVVGVGLPELEA